MRILFVLEYYHPHIGGVENLFKQLVEELVKRGNQVSILTNKYNSSLASSESVNGVEIRRYRFFNRYIFTFLAWMPAIRMARNADFIHSTSYNAALPAAIAAKFCGKKSIITFHEYWGELWYQLPWINFFTRRILRLFEYVMTRLPFDFFVGVSDYTCDALMSAGVPKNKIVRIYNGLDYAQYARTEDEDIDDNNEFSFCFFGRPSFSKGLDILLPAFQKLIKSGFSARLVMIVPSENYGPSSEVFRLIESGGIADRIKLFHNLSFEDLKSQIRQCDAVVIPSYSEGFCFAAAESVALGKPIIHSGRGALTEVVSGKSIATRELTIQALKEAMVLAINGQWTTSEIQHFHINRSVDSYIDLYSGLIG